MAPREITRKITGKSTGKITQKVTFSTCVATFLTVFLMGFLTLATQVAKAEVKTIDFVPDTVFTPAGFDDNDNSQVVLEGEFPNTCYRVANAEVKVDRQKKTIEIKEKALYYKGAVCLYMMVPYFKAINLGILDVGSYQILVNNSAGTLQSMGNLSVTKAPSANADDFIYAPVEEAHLEFGGSVPRVIVGGTFRKSCLRMKEMRVKVTGQVIVVLPIVEEDGSVCQDAKNPFEAGIDVSNLPKGLSLLHVRSLNGQAVNRVLNL